MFVKREILKLSHKLMKDDLRRSSLLLSAVSNQSLDERECVRIDACEIDNPTIVSPLKDVVPSESVIVPDTEKRVEIPYHPVPLSYLMSKFY